jgi:hypothetical protein
MTHEATSPGTLAPLPTAAERLRGMLHVFVALDWGEALDLSSAARLLPAETYRLPRHPRTPLSIQYTPPPLRVVLSPLELSLPILGRAAAELDVTLFDLAAVSAALHVPLDVTLPELSQLAGGLADTAAIVAAVRGALRPLFDRLRPALRDPAWSDLSEEYVVFQFKPQPALPGPDRLLNEHSAWLAGLVRLDASPLHQDERTEALRLRMSYTPEDLIVADWAAALVLDGEGDEVLDTLALANMQLLEFRQIDQQLDRQLEAVYPLIHRLSRTWLPFWRTHARPLRTLGKLKVDAHEMLERTSNVLKLIGDQYLARLYQLLGARFHLDEWGANIRRSITVLEGIYQVLSDQSATYRAELLEWMIVVLIAVEIVGAWLRS